MRGAPAARHFFGLGNAALCVLARFVWAYKRFLTGEMRRKTEKNCRWSTTPER